LNVLPVKYSHVKLKIELESLHTNLLLSTAPISLTVQEVVILLGQDNLSAAETRTLSAYTPPYACKNGGSEMQGVMCKA
jgi:hypothetical protein